MFNILNFFKSSFEEAKKLEFPSKKETYITTLTIFVVIVLTSITILLADFVIAKTISVIFGL